MANFAAYAAARRLTAEHCCRFQNPEPLGPTGMSISGVFIGSNDHEIADTFSAGTTMTVWLAVIARGQTQSDYDGGLPLCLKWRRHTLDSFRAIGYLTAEVLRKYVPTPMGARALSLRSAFSTSSAPATKKASKKSGDDAGDASAKPLGQLGKREKSANLFSKLQDLATIDHDAPE